MKQELGMRNEELGIPSLPLRDLDDMGGWVGIPKSEIRNPKFRFWGGWVANPKSKIRNPKFQNPAEWK